MNDQAWQGWTVVGLAGRGVVVGAEIARHHSLPLKALVVESIRFQKGRLFVGPSGNGYLFQNPTGPRKRILSPSPIRGMSGHRSKKQALEKLCRKVSERQVRFNVGGAFEPSNHVIVVDDGWSNGERIFAAITELRHVHNVQEVVVAIPIAPRWLRDEYANFSVRYCRRNPDLDFPRTNALYYRSEIFFDSEIVEILAKCA